MEIDEKGHDDTNIHYNIKKQKAIEQELGCKFIRIDHDKKGFDIFRIISEIFKHIKQATKKTLINKISRIFGLESKSDNITKSNAIKYK